MRYIKRHKILSVVLVIFTIYVYTNFTRIIEVNPHIDKTSTAYINDIYMSDERIYNNYLTETQKLAYEDLKDMFKKREIKRKLDLNKYNKVPSEIASDILTATEAIMLDHPEMLQLSIAGYHYNNSMIEARVEFAINNPVMEAINTLKIRRIIDDIRKETEDMNDLDKIKYVYEWIGENAVYDHLFTYTSKNQSIYNVFIKGNAVCAGFAKASQVIFQNIGIESMTVSGQTSGPHMWNIIKYNDKYYFYDSTYAASINDKTNPRFYDGLIQEELNNHIPDYKEWYPTIETTTGIYLKEEKQEQSN